MNSRRTAYETVLGPLQSTPLGLVSLGGQTRKAAEVRPRIELSSQVYKTSASPEMLTDHNYKFLMFLVLSSRIELASLPYQRSALPLSYESPFIFRNLSPS